MSNITVNHQAIDAAVHADLRVTSNKDFAHLATLNNSSILAEEIAEMVGSCPVVFLQDEDAGRFQLSALFGLLPDENLFVNEQDDWTGTYVPVSLNLGAFAVFAGAENENERVKIDENSPLISKTEGKALFENGKESTFLTDMRAQLETVIDASVQTENFIQNLVNRNLICEFGLTLNGLEGGPKMIKGLYTINTDELAYMAQEDVMMFHEMRFWGPLYAIQHSMKQFKKLVQLHNVKHPEAKISLEVHVDREEA